MVEVNVKFSSGYIWVIKIEKFAMFAIKTGKMTSRRLAEHCGFEYAN